MLAGMTLQQTFCRRRFIQRTALGLATATAAWEALAAEKPGYQIGCYTRCFDQFDYRTALDCIAEAGYQYAGIMTAKGKSWVMVSPQTPVEEAAEIGREVRQRNLKTISMYGDFSPTEGVENAIASLRRLIDNCQACGSPNLLLGGTTDEKLFEPYYKAVTEACDYAREKKIALSIKPHGGQNATGPQCRRIIEKVNKPNFQLWYDPGNIFYYSDGKLDPVEDSKHVDGLVSGMCVKDFKAPKEVLLTPGTGEVNFPAVLKNLQKGGFVRGPLVVECIRRGEKAEMLAEARNARQLLETHAKPL